MGQAKSKRKIYCKFSKFVLEQEGRSLTLQQCRNEFGCGQKGIECARCLQLEVINKR